MNKQDNRCAFGMDKLLVEHKQWFPFSSLQRVIRVNDAISAVSSRQSYYFSFLSACISLASLPPQSLSLQDLLPIFAFIQRAPSETLRTYFATKLAQLANERALASHFSPEESVALINYIAALIVPQDAVVNVKQETFDSLGSMKRPRPSEEDPSLPTPAHKKLKRAPEGDNRHSTVSSQLSDANQPEMSNAGEVVLVALARTCSSLLSTFPRVREVLDPIKTKDTNHTRTVR